jgi:hypothetical protein
VKATALAEPVRAWSIPRNVVANSLLIESGISHSQTARQHFGEALSGLVGRHRFAGRERAAV